MLAACAIVVIGLAGSITAALLWRASVRSREQQSFQTAAANISGTLETQLRRDTDFVQSARAVATKQPNLQARDLNSWLSLLENHRGRPAGYGALVIRDVPAKRLASYQARRNTDPAFRRLVAGHVSSIAPHGRADYCLLAGGSANLRRSSALTRAFEGDSCDPRSPIGGYRHDGATRAQFTQAITDADRYGVYSISLENVSSLIVEAPVYRPGAPLASVAQRRAAILGWVLGSFDIPSLMRTAVAGDRGLGVTLYHANDGLTPQFIGRLGAASTTGAFTHEAMLQVDGSWIVQVHGAPAASGPSANVQGLVVLLGGVLTTLLLAALVLVLARSREQAMSLVAEKTGQLRHQALHDALTGLPEPRARARPRRADARAGTPRTDLPVAALFVDIDGFKHVNDTLRPRTPATSCCGSSPRGCRASCARATPRRASAATSSSCCVEGSTLDAGPRARRRAPARGAARSRSTCAARSAASSSITASIGIAVGLREHAPTSCCATPTSRCTRPRPPARTATCCSSPRCRPPRRIACSWRSTSRDALDRDELFLVYQPIVRPAIRERRSRRRGAAALAAPRRAACCSPDEFIPLAEETGLIVADRPLGARGGVPPGGAPGAAHGHRIGVSVNVSARQLDTRRAARRRPQRARATAGSTRRALTLEITETRADARRRGDAPRACTR